MKEEKSFLIDLSQQAGDIALKYYRKEIVVEHKSQEHFSDPVSIADQKTEEFIRGEIEKVFPNDGIIGEEGDNKISKSGRIWLLDPIDGTSAFLCHRGSCWGVVIALLSGDFVDREIESREYFDESYQVELSAVYLPVKKKLFLADKSGAWLFKTSTSEEALKPEPVFVSKEERPLKESFIATYFSSKTKPKFSYPTMDLFVNSILTYNGCAGATEATRIISGQLDAWVLPFYRHRSIWDYIPMEYLVKQAGGEVLIYKEWHIVARNKALAVEIQELIAAHC